MKTMTERQLFLFALILKSVQKNKIEPQINANKRELRVKFFPYFWPVNWVPCWKRISKSHPWVWVISFYIRVYKVNAACGREGALGYSRLFAVQKVGC